MKPNPTQLTKEQELEQEIESRLQMIPTGYDRRKFRDLIQRVRTHEKNKSAQAILQERSIPDQLEDCQQILKELDGSPKPVKIFKEKESAKVSGQRPQFDEMIQGIKDGRWNSIVSWHPNRLARNILEGGMIIDLIDKGLLKDLRFHQCRFIPDSSGKMTLGFHFIMAKQYSDNL